MKFIVMGKDECGDDFYVGEIKVPEMEDFKPMELAYMVLEKRKTEYREKYNEEIDVESFFLERDFSGMSLYELERYAEEVFQ